MVIYKKILLNLLKSLIIAGVLTVIINYYYDLKLSISNPHFYFLFFGGYFIFWYYGRKDKSKSKLNTEN
jgi:hypothetical protein